MRKWCRWVFENAEIRKFLQKMSLKNLNQSQSANFVSDQSRDDVFLDNVSKPEELEISDHQNDVPNGVKGKISKFQIFSKKIFFISRRNLFLKIGRTQSESRSTKKRHLGQLQESVEKLFFLKF